MSDAENRAALVGAFLAEMRSRGVTSLSDPALAYHLALLLRPEGHPTIKAPPVTETPCKLCGEGTSRPPYCIECDMTGRSRADRASPERSER